MSNNERFKQFTVADPRDFSGDPFEVAERAVKQAEGIAQILHDTLEPTRIVVRNAQLERELLTDGECDAPAFDTSAQGRKLNALIKTAEASVKTLRVLARAAAYNPKKPPKA